MSVTLFFVNITEERINPFSIGYVINPTFNVNKVFIYQFEKCLKEKFRQSTMKGIKIVMRKKYTCVIELGIFYETKTKNPTKVYRMLSCVLYSFIKNYV